MAGFASMLLCARLFAPGAAPCPQPWCGMYPGTALAGNGGFKKKFTNLFLFSGCRSYFWAPSLSHMT